MGNGCDFGVVRQAQYRDRVHETDRDRFVGFLTHDDVAREKQADVGFGRQCAVRERWIAGGVPQDADRGVM